MQFEVYLHQGNGKFDSPSIAIVFMARVCGKQNVLHKSLFDYRYVRFEQDSMEMLKPDTPDGKTRKGGFYLKHRLTSRKLTADTAGWMKTILSRFKLRLAEPNHANGDTHHEREDEDKNVVERLAALH